MRLGLLALGQVTPPRDIHEYLLVFSKRASAGSESGESTIDKEEFMASTCRSGRSRLSRPRKWAIPLPSRSSWPDRVIRLFSYVGDVVLDPFNGAGTTCVAAKLNRRHYVGYDIEPAVLRIAEKRLARRFKEASTRPR